MGVLQSTASRRLNTGASRQLEGASQGGPPPLTGAAGTSVRDVAAMSTPASVTGTRWPRPAAGRPAVEIAHLRKSYGSLVAVDDISLSVAEGEIFGILGPNGAGKATTVECAIGLRSPDSGTVRLLGLDPRADQDEVHEIVGVQLQASAFPAKLRVGEILDMYRSFYRQPLLVMLAYALVFGYLAKRFFRWE